jgi:radical SAM superfamily enzyme YgiQ (UPF0313 family)
MTAANFSFVFVGIESTDAEVLGLTRKYHNLRSPLAESVDNMTRNGISLVASFVIGFDGEKKGAGDRICEFTEELNIPLVMLNLLQAMPGTSLWRRLQEEGRLLNGRASGDTTFDGEMNFIPSRPQREIIEEYDRATARLYEPTAFMKRSFQSILRMRPTRRALGIDDKNTVPAAAGKPDFKQKLTRILELKRLVRLIWRQGILPSHRWQFWRQLGAVLQKNPSRKVRYLHYCSLGESMFSYPRLVRKNPTGLSANTRQ